MGVKTTAGGIVPFYFATEATCLRWYRVFLSYTSYFALQRKHAA